MSDSAQIPLPSRCGTCGGWVYESREEKEALERGLRQEFKWRGLGPSGVPRLIEQGTRACNCTARNAETLAIDAATSQHEYEQREKRDGGVYDPLDHNSHLRRGGRR